MQHVASADLTRQLCQRGTLHQPFLRAKSAAKIHGKRLKKRLKTLFLPTEDGKSVGFIREHIP
jgi:hypothetical protein